jgi:predicted transcriptional regulator YdeE
MLPFRSMGMWLVFASAIVSVAVADMTPRKVRQEPFAIIGIAVRTSNAREATADGVIGKFWARLAKEGLLEKIPHKKDRNIIAIYTDYADGKDGEYTYILGARVTSLENIPPGMVGRRVDGGRYAVFTSAEGPADKVVAETWRRIWAALGGRRTYKTDFEVYDQRARNPQTAVVDIYVGIAE